MLKKEIYEEYFLNTTLSLFMTNISGFVIKYGGLDIASNCIFPLYEKEHSNIMDRISVIENFMNEQDIPPIYRIVYQENYKNLNNVLMSNRYEKIEQSIVVGCSLEGKKDALFRYADFNENGIFLDESISPGDDFLEDYFYLKGMNKEEILLFNDTIQRIPFKKYALSLVEEQHLLGQAYFIQQEDVVVIKDIVIHEKYRGLGYSSKILYSILTKCAKKDVNLVIAEIFTSNQSCLSLFSSNNMFEKLYDVEYKKLAQKKKGRFIFD